MGRQLNCRVENSLGSVRVSEDVVAAVAAAAASGVPGVRLVPGGIAGASSARWAVRTPPGASAWRRPRAASG